MQKQIFPRTVRCRHGDLAIVIRAQNPENIGMIVRVLHQDDEAAKSFPPGIGPVWHCESAHTMTWLREGKVYRSRRGPIPDGALQPIGAERSGQPPET